VAVPQASVPQGSIAFTLLLGVLVALTALGMDMFLPSVPVIAQAFGAEPGAAQHAVTTYLLGQIIGGAIGSRLVVRAGIGRMVRLGAALALAGGLLLAVLALARAPHWSAAVLPICSFTCSAAP
jgi:DHA1 family bicyclomycin/chloramphenicol resistance-like MFS transporter